MSRQILNYFFSAFFCVALTQPSFSQKKAIAVVFADTIKHKFLPTGVRIGTDLISIVKSRVTNNWSGWEVNADVDFYRYFLAVDYGTWSRHEVLPNGDYQNDGTYVRLGGDFNFMVKEREKNMFFLGFRYGMSKFSESTAYSYTDSLSGVSVPQYNQVTVSSDGVKAHWIELTTGLRLKIWGPFWMGYTARIKFGASVSGGGALHSFDIPGYGIAERSNTWGINYQLFWRIPVRKIK